MDSPVRESLAISENLVQSRQQKVAGITTVDFDGLLTTALRLHEDLAKGCGGQLWPAGMVLSRYMLLRHANGGLDDLSILELGAGGGLVGLALALQCKSIKTMHITDQKAMLDLMQRNIQLNALQDRVHASIYDWGEPVPTALPRNPDVVLAADCVYFEPAFPLLQQTMLDLIGDKTVCYFCFKKRRRADMHFVKAIKKLFDVQDIVDDPDRKVYSRQCIFLYKITKKNST